ncbi:MAG: glycosyltransferase family 2 protein [Vicinamibacterales bacterium]
MPTVIREVDISEPFEAIDAASHYERCMLLFRWRGRRLGRAFVPLEDGHLSARDVESHAQRTLGEQAVRACVEEYLDYDGRVAPDAPLPSATVAICTRERPSDLERALDAVAALAPAPIEILVVDNAPETGATRDVVRGRPGVRYVVEPNRGLNRARNRALHEAAGDVVAFTDDDAVPEAAWLGALLANFGDPRVICVTGLTLPLELESSAQELFEEHCSFVRGFRRRVFDGLIDNPLAVGPIGAGANMALRRGLGDAVGSFDSRLDAGTPTRSGGDHEMFARMLLAGHRIVYDPLAVSWHRHRRSLPELREVVRGYGTGVCAMWTGLLIERRELGVLRLAWEWFRHDHLPLLRRPRRLFDAAGGDALRRHELLGCLAGPWSWVASHRSGQMRA